MYTSRNRRPRQVRRRGLAMLIVMVSVSATLVLAFAFLQLQSTTVTVQQNVVRRDLALQAAQTGATVALRTIQSPTWQGVTVPLSGTLLSDPQGTSTYAVSFEPYSPPAGVTVGPEAAVLVTLRSTGTWTAAVGNAGTSSTPLTVSRQVEVVVRLEPRVPGRSLSTADDAAAVDVVANPGDYDTLQSYVAVGKKSSNALTVNVGSRLEGNLWNQKSASLFGDSSWSGTIRNRILDDFGERFVTATNGVTTYQSLHPLAGTFVTRQNVSGNLANDLTRLQTARAVVDKSLSFPEVSYGPYLSYKLYEGGFTYQAVTVGSLLYNTTLRPTATNPLGIFYRSGSVQVCDRVILQGTLVSTGTLTVCGRDSHLSSYNWRGDGGAVLVNDGEVWPRLPAIVADNVVFTREAATSVEGAVITRQRCSGAGGAFGYRTPNGSLFTSGNFLTLTGSATVAPLQQPYSRLQFTSPVNLSVISGDLALAVWVPQGGSGSWYPIAEVDPQANALTLRGEVHLTSPATCTIRPHRLQFVDIRGPVLANEISLEQSATWSLDSSTWSDLYNLWNSTISALPAGAVKPKFTEWLATPANFAEWGSPYKTYGFSLEPTFHARHGADAVSTVTRFQFAPPFFQPYRGTTSDTASAGYRWKVVSWRPLD